MKAITALVTVLTMKTPTHQVCVDGRGKCTVAEPLSSQTGYVLLC